MNNVTYCTDNLYILNEYFFRALHALGIVTNLVCIIVFIKILREHNHADVGHTFKYLLVKSVTDCAIFCFIILNVAYTCNKCAFKDSYVMQIWYIYIYNYATHVLEICSVVFEVAATFDCYITLTKKLKLCHHYAAFIIVCICTMVFSASLNVFYLFSFTISEKYNDSGYTFSSSINYSFYVSDVYRSLVLTSIIVRDILPLASLLILNFLILNILRNMTQRRRVLELDQTATSNLVTSAERAERAKIIMISMTGLNYVFGHVPYLIKNFKTEDAYPNFKSTTEIANWKCYAKSAEFIFYFSFTTPICFYFAFNQKFKRIILACLSRLRINLNKNNNNRQIAGTGPAFTQVH